MKKKKQKDTQNLEVTDGKYREIKTREQQLKEIEDLEEILGTGKLNPYGTTSLATFEKKVTEMTLDELRFLASRVGLTPVNRENLLKIRLVESFKDFLRTSRNVSGPKNAPDANHPAILAIKDLIDGV